MAGRAAPVLDVRIVLKLPGADTVDGFGNAVAGAPTDAPVWASRMTTAARWARAVSIEGDLTPEDRAYVIRYRDDVLDGGRLIDEEGVERDFTPPVPFGDRRRHLALVARRVV